MRNAVFYVHLVVGFAVGLLLTSAGLTGAVLVWRPQLDVLLNPGLLRTAAVGPHIEVDRAVEAAVRAHPEHAPALVQVPRAPHETFEITTAGADPIQIFVDPVSGAVLGSRGVEEGFTNALFAWHTTLLSGETGERVMGTAALLLLVLVATGVVVWWPGLRRMADGVRIRWSASWKRVNFDAHRAVGIWSTPFLTVAAVTGSSLVFHDAYMAGLDRITRSPGRVPPPVAEATGAPPAPLHAAVRAASTAVPEGTVTYVTIPAAAGDPVLVRLKVPGELHPNGRNFVYVHPETTELLAVERALAAPAGTRAYNVLYPIHIGRWGGPASRIAYSLFGLTPAILFISGCLMWWNRSGRRTLLGRRQRRSGDARQGRPDAAPGRAA